MTTDATEVPSGPRSARLNRGRRLTPWVLAAALVVSLPALSVDLVNDDLLHRLELQNKIPGYEHAWLSLYDFTPERLPSAILVDLGYLPWFSHEQLSLRFFRPLSSALLALDYALFKTNVFFPHVHSLLWFVALVAITHRLYARWFEQRAATLSALVFAMAGYHAMSIAWLAARHSLVAATFGALGLYHHLRFREDHVSRGRSIALLSCAAGLCASEVALGALVFLVVYELMRQVSLEQRISGAAPYAVLGLAYLAGYALLGYGTRGSGAYIFPFDAPGQFALAALVRVPILIGDLLLGMPAVLAKSPATELSLAMFGFLAIAFYLFVFVRYRALLTLRVRRCLGWLAASTPLALVPAVGTIIGGRVLLFAAIGGAALVGNALNLLLEARNRLHEGPKRGRRRRYGIALAVGLLAILHFGFSPSVRVGLPLALRSIAEGHKKLAREADLGACPRGGAAYLLTGSDPALSLYAGFSFLLYRHDGAPFRRFRVLSMAPQAQQLTRVGENSFELQVLGPVRKYNAFELLYRARNDPLRVGWSRKAEELSVRVMDSDGGLFTRARFDTAPQAGVISKEVMPAQGTPARTSGRPVESAVCLLVWQSGKLKTLAWPAVGEATLIEHEPGPLGF